MFIYVRNFLKRTMCPTFFNPNWISDIQMMKYWKRTYCHQKKWSSAFTDCNYLVINLGKERNKILLPTFSIYLTPSLCHTQLLSHFYCCHTFIVVTFHCYHVSLFVTLYWIIIRVIFAGVATGNKTEILFWFDWKLSFKILFLIFSLFSFPVSLIHKTENTSKIKNYN